MDEEIKETDFCIKGYDYNVSELLVLVLALIVVNCTLNFSLVNLESGDL